MSFVEKASVDASPTKCHLPRVRLREGNSGNSAEEALQARRETLGHRHPSTLRSINNMGAVLYAMGNLEEARPLFKEALQASRETLGDHHPSTLLSMKWLDTVK